MAVDTIGKNNIDLIILQFLSRSDMYGYQISRNVFLRSGGKLNLNMGAMYASLYRLKEAGYISDYEQISGKRRTRVYYHLEPSGRIHLKERLEQYREQQRVMDACLFSEEEMADD